MYVADALAPYVDVLDHRGRMVGRIEPPRDENGDPARFGCLALGNDGRVYATLSGVKTRVAVFGDDLSITRVIALDAPKAERSHVTAMTVGPDGRIYVTDPFGAKMVQVFDAEGRYVTGFGEHDSGFENFSFPSGIVLMDNGNLWVVDSIRQVASCFSPEGEFITYVGGKGSGPGAFNFPSSIASDGENFLFVLEKGGNRFQCFEFGESE
jgi:DNA-binding beta-propeller fold protein YncE